MGSKVIISLQHLTHRPIQRRGRLFRICHNRNQKVRNPVIHAQLYHLRVNQKQLNLFGVCLIKNTRNQRIDADRFPRTRCARNQQVRHFCNIRHNRVACNILPQGKGKLRGVLLKGIAFQQRPHINRLCFLIRHFNADCRLAGNGCFNTNPACRQIQRDIIRQIHNLADLYALARRKLIARHSRTSADFDYLCIHTKAFQRSFQLSCIFK